MFTLISKNKEVITKKKKKNAAHSFDHLNGTKLIENYSKKLINQIKFKWSVKFSV